MNKTTKPGHKKDCNEVRHAQRDSAHGYKTLCDGNRACESCFKGVAYPLSLATGGMIHVCEKCYESRTFKAMAAR